MINFPKTFSSTVEKTNCQNIVQKWICVRILNNYKNTPRKKKSLVMSFLQNTKLFLECVSVLLLVIVDRRLFTSDHSLLLAAVSQLNV